MGGLSLMHWVVVAAVVAIFFGPSRLPELGQGMGEMLSNFRKAFRDGQDPATPPQQPTKSIQGAPNAVSPPDRGAGAAAQQGPAQEGTGQQVSAADSSSNRSSS